MEESERIARYAPQGDAAGLAAYALHRRALLAFRGEFLTRHARPPEAVEEAAFLLGEETPERIDAYRRQAAALIAGTALSPPRPAQATEKQALEKQAVEKQATEKQAVEKKERRLFFAPWAEAAVAQDPVAKVNWRGLLARLALLLAAVVATAILLRRLFL